MFKIKVVRKAKYDEARIYREGDPIDRVFYLKLNVQESIRNKENAYNVYLHGNKGSKCMLEHTIDYEIEHEKYKILGYDAK